MYSGKIAVPLCGGEKNKKNNQMQTRSNKKKTFRLSDLDKLSLLLNNDEQTRTFYLLHFKIYN
jgi:hypothetical protein